MQRIRVELNRIIRHWQSVGLVFVCRPRTIAWCPGKPCLWRVFVFIFLDFMLLCHAMPCHAMPCHAMPCSAHAHAHAMRPYLLKTSIVFFSFLSLWT